MDHTNITYSSSCIRLTNAYGAAFIKTGIVKAYDIKTALKATRAILVPEGYQILHIIPQYFIIDGKERIANPLNKSGAHLEVHAHVILDVINSLN